MTSSSTHNGDTSPSLSLVQFDQKDRNLNVDGVGIANSPPTLSNGTAAGTTTNIFDVSQEEQEQHHTPPLDLQKVPAAPTYIFAVIPIILFAILVIASCYIRKGLSSYVESAREKDRQEQRRQKEEQRKERRNKLVGEALVSTKVTRLFAAARGRTSTVETLGTANSSSSSDIIGDLSRRSSVESSARIIGDELSDAEQGGVLVHSMDSTSDGSSANHADIDDIPNSNKYSEDVDSEEKDTTTLQSPLDWLQQNEECAICLEPYKENDDISYSKHQNCNHAFHTTCIVSWLKDEFHNDCPCCRGPYVHPNLKEDELFYPTISGSDFSVLGGSSMIHSGIGNNHVEGSVMNLWRSGPMDIAESTIRAQRSSAATANVATIDGTDFNISVDA